MQIQVTGVLPERQHESDAGADLFAAHDAVIPAGGLTTVDTGTAVQLPENTAGFVMARSGLAFSRGVGLANGVGLIDSGFRGSIKVALVNHGRETVIVKSGQRIAQLVIVPIFTPVFEQTDRLDDSDRGDNGFGSTAA